MRATRISLLLLSSFALSFALTSAIAEDSVEFKIKAGFLYKFPQFVDWPPEAFGGAKAPLIIGVLGDDPFGDVLDKTVRDREVEGRKVVVRRYKSAQSAREAHVLYIGLSGEQLASSIKALEGAPVLTVGENSAFNKDGGAVRFVVRDDRVAFNINPEAAKRAGLKIRAQLLKLARIVDDQGE